MTYEIRIERLTPETLHLACNTEQVPPEMTSALMDWPRPACAVFPDTVLQAWGVIVVWLPGTSSAALELLSSQEPIVMNFHSADFMAYRTMLCWKVDHAPEVRLDMWLMTRDYLDCTHGQGFGVVLMNESTAFYSSHQLDNVARDAFIASLQGAMISSGPNYRPYRMWNDTFLEACRGRPDAGKSQVICPDMLSWSIDCSAVG